MTHSMLLTPPTLLTGVPFVNFQWKVVYSLLDRGRSRKLLDGGARRGTDEGEHRRLAHLNKV